MLDNRILKEPTLKLLTFLVLFYSFSAFAETVKEFSNGCTRTCTGSWSYNSGSDTFTCNGTAGPLHCGSEKLGHTDVLGGRGMSQGTTFTSSGSPATNAATPTVREVNVIKRR
jgi:hypothetical protein